jgi:hypothetical protein
MLRFFCKQCQVRLLTARKIADDGGERMNSCACNKAEATGILKCTTAGRFCDHDDKCDCKDQDQVIIKGVCPRKKIEEMLDEKDRLWTQLFLPEILCIPEQKPDIEQLLSVTVVTDIISQRVIKTPVLKIHGEDTPIENNEGIVTTGRKLVLEGVLRQKITYVADVESQSVHAAHFDLPFSAFIILPPKTKLSTKFDVTVCIEDIFVCILNSRQIFKNVTIFIKAEPLDCAEGGK